MKLMERMIHSYLESYRALNLRLLLHLLCFWVEQQYRLQKLSLLKTNYYFQKKHLTKSWAQDKSVRKIWRCNCRNEGEYSWCENCIPESGEQFKGAYYNPYKYKTFVEDISKKPIFKSKRVIIRDKTAIGPHFNIFYIPEPKKKRVPWNKGKKFSIESRRKMSLSHKGHIPWNKGKKGVQVAWNKGLKLKQINERRANV